VKISSLAALVIYIGIPLVASATAQRKINFPSITPTHLAFVAKGRKTIAKEVIIRTRQKAPAYRLTVSAVCLDKKSFETIETDLNGIGAAATRFDTKYEDNLLNPDRLGHGAIGFIAYEFREHPNQYVVYRLRRMKITLTVSDVVLDEDKTGIISATITVEVRSDPTTQSRPVRYSDPVPTGRR
jgi:hypothetical protein